MKWLVVFISMCLLFSCSNITQEEHTHEFKRSELNMPGEFDPGDPPCCSTCTHLTRSHKNGETTPQCTASCHIDI